MKSLGGDTILSISASLVRIYTEMKESALEGANSSLIRKSSFQKMFAIPVSKLQKNSPPQETLQTYKICDMIFSFEDKVLISLPAFENLLKFLLMSLTNNHWNTNI